MQMEGHTLSLNRFTILWMHCRNLAEISHAHWDTWQGSNCAYALA